MVGDERVGEVTSGTKSPTLGKAIGMAYVRSDLAEPGTELEIDVRGKRRSGHGSRRGRCTRAAPSTGRADR